MGSGLRPTVSPAYGRANGGHVGAPRQDSVVTTDNDANPPGEIGIVAELGFENRWQRRRGDRAMARSMPSNVSRSHKPGRFDCAAEVVALKRECGRQLPQVVKCGPEHDPRARGFGVQVKRAGDGVPCARGNNLVPQGTKNGCNVEHVADKGMVRPPARPVPELSPDNRKPWRGIARDFHTSHAIERKDTLLSRREQPFAPSTPDLNVRQPRRQKVS
jgi:hypothetical protein